MTAKSKEIHRCKTPTCGIIMARKKDYCPACSSERYQANRKRRYQNKALAAKTPGGLYAGLIVEFTGITAPDELRSVEEAMRTLAGGVLDHITRPGFRELARTAAEALGLGRQTLEAKAS